MQSIRPAKTSPENSTALYTKAASTFASASPFLIASANKQRIQALPVGLPSGSARRMPLIVRANRILKTALIALCGLAILGYGLDVAASNDVGKLQEQARRLNEQNTELSAQLLRVISFQGISDSILGSTGLRVPDKVMIIKEIEPAPPAPFHASKHHLPLLAGY